MKRFITLLSMLLMLAIPIAAQQVVLPYINPSNSTPTVGRQEVTGITTDNLLGNTVNNMGGATSTSRHYLTSILCINPSTTAGLTLRIYNGPTNTAGTTAPIAVIPCAASGTSDAVYFPIPLKFSMGTSVQIGIGTTSQTTKYLIMSTGYIAR